MKKLNLTNNMVLKVLSVFAAVVVWLIVWNISDAETSRSFNLNVTIENTDVITDQGMVYRVEDGTDNVKVTVRARQSVIRDLRESDFVLTADMEKDLKYDSMVGIRVKCKNTGINVDEDVTLSRSNVSVSIEDSIMEQFPVYVTWTGTLNDGVVVGSLVPEQTVIKISGPISIVERIKTVEASVDVTGLPATAVRTCSLKLYNSDREEIDPTFLNFSGKKDGIDVTVSMLETKNVPVSVVYSGIPAENYQVASVEWKPEYVEIAGTASVLSGVAGIRIPEEAVNVDGVSGELQLLVDITPYLPTGVILTDESSASVLIIVNMEYVEPEETEEEKEKGNQNPSKTKDSSTKSDKNKT